MRPGAVLTERDVEVLHGLRRLGALTTEQIGRLGFPSRQTALRRLRRLEAAGLIRCSSVPTLPVRLVTLTPRGAESMPGAGEYARQTRRLPRALFLHHFVAVNDLRLALEESLRQSDGVELLDFFTDRERMGHGAGRQPRPLLSFAVSDERGAIVRHIPDAIFTLRRGDRVATFLAELDLGTEVVGDGQRGVGKIMRFYLNALTREGLGGLESALPGTMKSQGFRVLFLTVSTRRIEGIRRRWGAAAFQPEAAKRFIWLGTLDALRGRELLRWPWVSLDPEDTASYPILSEKDGQRS